MRKQRLLHDANRPWKERQLQLPGLMRMLLTPENNKQPSRSVGEAPFVMNPRVMATAESDVLVQIPVMHDDIQSRA